MAVGGCETRENNGTTGAVMMGEPARNQVFVGTFVHCGSRRSLDFLHDAAVAVDRNGQIVGIERGGEDATEAKEKLVASLQWQEDDVAVCVAPPGRFFFPGFVGE